jgi:hypothetical protein
MTGRAACSIQGGAEFQDAGAGGFYGSGEREGGGFVEEKDDAIEFAFAGAASQGEANGMEEVAAANVDIDFQLSDELLELLGRERRRVEKQ